ALPGRGAGGSRPGGAGGGGNRSMSLLQLLAVGRSLETIKDEPSRYRMTQHLLPKFGPPARAETKMPDAVQAQSRPVVEEQHAPVSQPEPQAKKNEMNALHTKPPAPSR